MDIKQFTNESPGRLIAIQADWGADHSFIPDALPPRWEFPGFLWPQLAEAKAQLGLLEGVGRGLPNPMLLLQPLSRREALQSSALEGTFSTAEQLLLFEHDPKQPESKEDPVNDWLEVANYRRALEHGINSKLPLSTRLLKEMHKILLTGVRGKDRTPGLLRSVPVGIGSGGRFIPPPHGQVENLLDDMEKYIHTISSEYDPLVVCFLVHYQFETIHPFSDGNGRIGRLLLAMMIQKLCKLSKPWLYMSGYYNRYREEYAQHLFNISAKADWTSWVKFCLQGTLEQARDTITRCEKLRCLKEKYVQQVQQCGGSARLIQIVEELFNSPFIEVTKLKKLTNVSYPTAKADAGRLVEIGILKVLPKIRPATYCANEIFKIAYDDLQLN